MPPLRGRERQWAQVLRLLDAARSAPRRGGVLLVEGPPGSGRSRLLTDAAAQAGRSGFSVAHASADEVRRAVPLAPLLAALSSVTGMPCVGTGSGGGAGGPGSGPAGGEPMAAGPTALIDRLRLRLEERLRNGPAAVLLDDLHWADPVTLAAVRTLVTRFAGHPLVWVLARCAGRGGSAVDRLYTVLHETEGAELVPLERLSATAVAEVAAERLGARPTTELAAYAEGTDGNPAALVALLDGLTEEGRVRIAGGEAGLTRGTLPAGGAPNGLPPRRFSALVRRRMESYRPATRLLLDVAAVLGRDSTPDDMSRMLGEPTAAALPALQEALDSGTVVCEDDTIAFRHELVRQALLATIPGPLRGALHRQAADMILGRHGGVLRAAGHLVHGARRGDAQAVEVLCTAASEVAAAEPGTSAELALRALEISGPGDAARPRLLRTAVESLTRVGPLPRAVTLARESLDGEPLPPGEATALHCGLSRALLLSGRPREAMAAARAGVGGGGVAAVTGAAAVAVAGATGACDYRAEAELNRLHGLAALDLTAAAREASEEAGRRGGSTAGMLGVLATVYWRAGRVQEALDLCREAVERADESPSSGDGPAGLWQVAPQVILAVMLTRLRQTTEARAMVERLSTDVEAAGWPVLRGAPVVLGAALALTRGASDTAVAKAGAGLAAADEAGMPLFSPLAWRILADVALRRGDLATADGHIQRLAESAAGQAPGQQPGPGQGQAPGPGPGPDALERGAPERGVPERGVTGQDGARETEDETYALTALGAWMAAQLAAARGDPEGLATARATVHRDRAALRRLLVEEPAAAGWLVRAALDAGESERAAETVQIAEQLSADNAEVPALVVAAVHARGLCERDPWALRRAAEEHKDPWAGASAAEDLGSLSAADRTVAVDALDRAMAGYARLGAERDEARVRRRLRQLGVRRRHWTLAHRPTSGWASLTGTERRVADLVAQGLTNRQAAAQMFLSPHTVGFHLRQIFRKLQIQSRIDLVRMHPDATDGPRGAA